MLKSKAERRREEQSQHLRAKGSKHNYARWRQVQAVQEKLAVLAKTPRKASTRKAARSR